MLGISQVSTKAIQCLEPRMIPKGVVMEEHQNATDMENAESTLQDGIDQGYGHWLEPFAANRDDRTNQTPEIASSNSSGQTQTEPVPERRKRGRPRVNTTRNGSAIEKRRAQVRNAQRTYQKRKDEASHTVSQRCDELLQALSDLSTAVEDLLGSASKAGTLNQKDEMTTQMQQLWNTYDTVINQPSVQPELRLLKIKNGRRQADHQEKQKFIVDHLPRSKHGAWPMDRGIAQLGNMELAENDPSLIGMAPGRGDDTTLIQNFNETHSQSKIMGGRSIFDIVAERQAQLRNSENPAP